MRYHADPSTTHNYISNKERLKLSPTRDSNLRHHKRAIFIEKEYPEIEKTNKYLIDNVDPVIKRGQSRISWNLDENDNRETTTTNEVEAMNFNNNNNHDMYQINMDRRVRPSSSSQHITLPHSRQNGSTISRQTATLQSQSKYRTPVDDESIDGNDHIESRRYKRNKYYPATIATTKNNINLTSYPPTENMLPRPDTELEAEDKPEQVYVCRCCGLACELAPSVRYLHRFRVAFFVFNFLVLVFGVANFGMGLWFRIDPKVYELHKYIQTNNYTSAGWIMLFAGFAVTIIALVGFRAAAKSKPGYLIFYFVMVAIVTLLLMGALVLVTVYGLGESLEQFATKEVFQQIQNKTRSDKSAQFLDFIQIKMKCCGASSFLDYANLGMNPPVSCYAINRNYVNAPGCGRAFRELFDIRAGMAAGFSASSIFVQLLAITMAAIMFCIIYHSRIPNSSTYDQNNRPQFEG